VPRVRTHLGRHANGRRHRGRVPLRARRAVRPRCGETGEGHAASTFRLARSMHPLRWLADQCLPRFPASPRVSCRRFTSSPPRTCRPPRPSSTTSLRRSFCASTAHGARRRACSRRPRRRTRAGGTRTPWCASAWSGSRRPTGPSTWCEPPRRARARSSWRTTASERATTGAPSSSSCSRSAPTTRSSSPRSQMPNARGSQMHRPSFLSLEREKAPF
jgi:hypothetical protein